MTLLVLLARAAPARVVAPDLVALVHMPRLDVRQQLGGLVVVAQLHARCGGAASGGGSGQRAGLVRSGAARVAEVARGARVRAGGPRRARRRLLCGLPVLALYLHLHSEDVAGGPPPD